MPSQVNRTLSTGRRFAWHIAKWWDDPDRRALILARFWANVKRADAKACWNWHGYVNTCGYGVFSADHQRIGAHRLVWLLARGGIPDGLSVLHHCDNPRCVNPSHLFIGTQADNMHDAVRKGRKRAWGLQKLNAEQVREIRACVAAGQLQREVAAAFGISRNHVSSIVHRTSWAHLDAVPEPVSVSHARIFAAGGARA